MREILGFRLDYSASPRDVPRRAVRSVNDIINQSINQSNQSNQINQIKSINQSNQIKSNQLFSNIARDSHFGQQSPVAAILSYFHHLLLYLIIFPQLLEE
jgi:hypothetical protein